MARPPLPRIERCPQCGFRFRGRPEDHQHLSPAARRLQWSGYLAIFPAMLGVAAFLYLTRSADGLMIDFTSRANTITLAIFTPSIVLFTLSLWVPKHATYRCPQCSWERTLRPNDRVESAKTDEFEKQSEVPPK
ncbi:MAG TPA: hypothetical protein VHX44_05015 [Planctomycetota bacterium]|jgi:DNA-directed RNA polymerase subunit RPC12/RpoP|nr:hypothetical protein [Planctomycetota bacterium]